jgi:hypothetical protein
MLLAPLLVHGALRLRLAGLGVDEAPALLHAAVGRGQRVSAIALWKRSHGRRIGLGQGGVGVAPGGRHTGDPLPLRLGQVLKIGLTREGTIGDQGGQALGGWPLMHRAPNRRAKAVGITAVATAWLHQAGDTRLMRHHQRHHDLISGRPMIPARTAGDGHDLCLGCLGAVVAPIDMNARRVEMDQAGCKPQTRGSGCRKEAVECGHPRGIEGLQGPAAGLIGELCRGHAGRNELVGGRMVEASGAPVAGLSAKPQAIEPHGFDGFTHGKVAHFRVLLGRLIADLAHAECVEHARDKAAVVSDVTMVHGLIRHHHLLCW